MENKAAPSGSDTQPKPRRNIFEWFGRHPKSALVLALAITLISVYSVIDHLAHRRFERCMADIRAKGEPLTMDDLRRLDPKIPESQNMSAALLKAARPFLLLKSPPNGGTSEFESCWTQPLPNPGERSKPEDVALFRKLLDTYPDALNQMHVAAQMERAGFDWKWQANYMKVMLPTLRETKWVQRLLVLDSLLGVETAEQERAVQSLVDSIRGIRSFDSPWQSEFGDGIRAHLSDDSIDQAERVLNRFELEPVELQQLTRELEHFSSYTSFKPMLLAKRILFMDRITSPRYRNTALEINRSTSGRLFVWNYLPVTHTLDIARALERLAQLIDESEIAESDLPATLARWDAENGKIPDAFVNTHVQSPSLTLILRQRHAAIARTRALLAAIAAERYRIEHHAWPASLDELVPEYLDAVPNDPFDGKPIRYAKTADGIKSWSVGGNLKDERGKLIRANGASGTLNGPDIGCEILNPESRDRLGVPADNSRSKQSP